MINDTAQSDNPFILDLLDSLQGRSKALKHKNAIPVVRRFVDTAAAPSGVRIEITFRGRGRQLLTLTAWEDRSIRVHACEAIWQAGWKFKYHSSGRFIGSEGGRQLVQALEASLSTMFEMTADNVSKLNGIWGPLLANGPQPV